MEQRRLLLIKPCYKAAARWRSPLIQVLFLLMCLLPQTGRGQATVTIGSTSGSSSYYYGPIYRSSASSSFDYSRYAYLYTDSELGIPAGSIITKVEWLRANSNTLTGNNTFNIWLDNTNTTTLTSGTSWNTLETGATPVYASTTQTFTGSTGTWESYDLAPFIYTGSNLLILTDHEKLGTASGSITYYYNNATGFGIGWASSTAPTSTTTLSTSSYGNKRPTIRITYSSGTPCTGTPTATLSASVDSTCAATPFSLDASAGGMAAGLSYLYQVSTDGGATWTSLDTPLLSPYYTVAGQSMTSQYRVIVSCAGGGSDTSTPVTVAQSGFLACYCTPSISSGCGTYGAITHVGFNTISNTSTCAGGSHFTSYPNADSTVTTVNAGSIYTLSVDLARYSYVYAWIDYDHSGTFDAEEFTMVNTTYHTITGQQTYDTTVTIPSGAMPGLTRMRVRSTYYSYPFEAATGACTTSTYGEAEDYWINVIGATPCAGTPVATLTSSMDSTCPDIPFVLTAGPTGSSGLTYQFQKSTDMGATWTSLGTSTIYPTYTIPTQTVTTQYRVIVMCAGGSADTAAVTVTQSLPTSCYCVPSGTTATRYVNDFSTTGGITNISNLGTGWSPGGYGYFVSQQATANPGGAVDFNAVFGSSGTYGFKIWIDWNQDGDLTDAGETVFTSSSYAASHSGTFDVPLSAPTGPRRMRIGNSYTPSTGPAGPCSTGISGEFEDYTFVVVPLLPCAGMPTAGSVAASLDTLCPGDYTNMELSGYSSFVTGISIQWQESNSPTGPFTDVSGGSGDTTDAYTTDTLTATTYYRAKVTCTSSGMESYSDTQAVVVQIVEVVSTTPGMSCLPGPVTLGATGTPGATLHWWDAPVDGTELDTGAIFVTPPISTTTTYYVSAASGSGGSLTAGRETPQASSTGYGYDDYGLIFTATAPFHLTSVDVYPTASAGMIAIALRDASGTILQTSGPLSFSAGTGTTFGSGATPVTLTLDFDVPVGVGLELVATDITANLIRDNPISGWSYPLPIGDYGNITGGLLAGSPSTGAYYYFFNWQLGAGCSSDRVPVSAHIGGLPVLTAQPVGDTICEGQTLTLSVSATGADTYQWYGPDGAISGATDATYTLPDAALSDGGAYYVMVAGPSGCGEVVSDTVNIMVGVGGQWLGITPSWNDAVNWCGGVPTATSDILIPAASTVAFEPVVMPGYVAEVRNLAVFNSLLTVDGEMRFYGDVTNLSDGALDAEEGTISLMSTAPQTIELSFKAANLNIMGGGEKLMQDDIIITNNLALTDGILNMGNARITLWPGATLTGGSAASYIRTGDMGGLKQEVSTAETHFPVGRSAFNPVTLTNASGPVDFTVRVRDEVLTDGYSGAPVTLPTYVVNRTWFVEQEAGSSADATLSLQWNSGEENSTAFNYSKVFIAQFREGAWVNTCCPDAALAPPAIGFGPYKAIQTGLGDLSLFSVSSAGGEPLNIPMAAGAGFVMKAFPNPATDLVTVALTGNNHDGKVSLTDLSGRELMAHFPENGKVDFDIRSLAAGMYFLTYTDSQHRYTIKVQKK